ncbi:uncharacterized protein LOC142521311 [Primulina tabacum]|uniref:uncharacterized protein LOC142521311 n=1 Tax=Primulina tabacum TaxID=48773 RepID=UPI003F594707
MAILSACVCAFDLFLTIYCDPYEETEEVDSGFGLMNPLPPLPMGQTPADQPLLPALEEYIIVVADDLRAPGRTIDWDVFRSRFLDKYFSIAARQKKEREFEDLRPGIMSVAEYESLYSALLKYVSHVTTNVHAKMRHFLRGLKLELFDRVQSNNPVSFEDAVTRAEMAELVMQKYGAQGRLSAPTRESLPRSPVLSVAVWIIKPGIALVLRDSESPGVIEVDPQREVNDSLSSLHHDLLEDSHVCWELICLRHMCVSHTFISKMFVVDHRMRRSPLSMPLSVSIPSRVDISVVSMISDDKKERWTFYEKGSRPRVPLVSAIQISRLLEHGHEGYLIYALDVTEKKKEVGIEKIHVVDKFADVFLDEISGFPPAHEVEFGTELMPGTSSISRAPYIMAQADMRELKAQLQDLLDKGYIRHSVSLWGAPVLFVRKKTGTTQLCIDYR